MKIDKVVVANRAALDGKYGAAGLADIDAALSRLVAADAARSITTQVVNIDDAAECAAFGVGPIVNANDEAGAKRVVDAIDAAASPDYILLLDGPDVVPQITLAAIRGLTDGDPDIPSDLPYACAAPFSNDAATFLSVTRVVGRLPMPRGSSDHAALVKLIDFSCAHASRPAADFTPHFTITADVWKVSTQLNLSTLFGGTGALQTSPTAGHTAIDALLPALTHLINCHGATNDPRFYGQSGRSYPVAMISANVAPHVAVGTVVGVECCFGAELYDPALLAGGGQPMSLSYLWAGAAAFVGSTNTAYGPANANAQADLIVQFHLQEVLKGASTGRAFLQARQRFVMSQKMADPTNLKTLAQFVLYGDPCLQPVVTAPTAFLPPTAAAGDRAEAKSMPDINPRSARTSRRLTLKSEGDAIGSSATRIGGEAAESELVRRNLETLAKMRGFAEPVDLYDVKGSISMERAAKSLGKHPRIAVTAMRETVDDASSGRHVSVRVLVAHVLNDDIVQINETASR